MAFDLCINSIPVLFAKAFTALDRDSILAFVRQQAGKAGRRRVLFIDTPSTSFLVEAITILTGEGVEIFYRDHHGLSGPATNDREQQTEKAVAHLRELLGSRARVTSRMEHPACSTLVETGEFHDALLVVADPDADGLTATMKALGVTYPELDADAAILDGPSSRQLSGSPIAQLLVKGLGIVASEEKKGELFSNWVLATQGDQAAKSKLETYMTAYQDSVTEAERLLDLAVEVVPGVWLVDAVGAAHFDRITLSGKLESRTGCRIIVTRTSKGSIAKLHDGVQYSLAVSTAHHATINLQTLLPQGFISSPQVGILSNMPIYLHVSQKVWNEVVLPALHSRFVDEKG